MIIFFLLLLCCPLFAQPAVQPCGFSGDQVSRSFTLRANGVNVPVVEVPAMTGDERQMLQAAYQKMPSYCHIDDPACMHLHVAHMLANSNVRMEITAQEEIKEFRIHPLAWEIKGKVKGRALYFKVVQKRQPAYYIVRINQLPPLMVAVDSPEKPNADTIHVLDAAGYITDRTGAIEQTNGILAAFAAANGTGKTVHMPAGVYLVDQLRIRGGHDFKINLAPGCVLKVKHSAHGENEHRHGLWLENCHNVTITGRGAIDHQAYEHYVVSGNNYQHGMIDYYTSNELCPWISQSPLFITGCRNILIEGITIRNGRNFNINARNCDSLTIREVKIFTPPACTPEYADGINTSSCRDVHVENCFVACNDDCFASGHYFAAFDNRSSQNHMVCGMLGWNMRANAIRLGFYSNFDQGDFTFEDCHFVAMPFGAVLIHALRNKSDGSPCRYGSINMIDCYFDDAQRLPSLFKIEKAAVEKFTMENVVYYGPTRPASRMVLEGAPGAPIKSALLKNVRVNGKKIRAADDSLLQLRNISDIRF